MSLGRERKGRRVVVWPVNIDASETLSRGRKIPLSHAVRKPRVEEMLRAAEELGLNPEVEAQKYPRKWWEERKRIVVDKVAPKREIMKQIATRIRAHREKR